MMSCTVRSPADSLAQPTCILVYIECNPAPGGSPFELSLGLCSNSRVLPPPSLLRVSCVVVRPRFCLGSPHRILAQSLAPSLRYHLQICSGIFRTPRLTNLLTARRRCMFTSKTDRLANGRFMPLPAISFLLDRTAACLMKKIAGGTKVSFIHRVFMLTFHVGLMGLSPEHALSATSFRHDQLDIPSADISFFSRMYALNLP